MKRRILRLCAVVGVVLWSTVTTTAAFQIARTTGARYAAGRGKLIFDDQVTDRREATGAQLATNPHAKGWSIAVEQVGNSVKGRITARDDGTEQEASIDAAISGAAVSGAAYDVSGRKLATFEGTLTQDGFGGTFRTVEGRVGSWQWDGAPSRLSK